MAQNIIDIGAAANDGTGEPLRQAFEAVNNNFTQIFAAGPVDSNVVISGNTITGCGTDGIALNAANKNAVTGNVCTTNSNYGLRVVANSADVAVVGNMLLGNTVGSIGNSAGLTGASVNANNVV